MKISERLVFKKYALQMANYCIMLILQNNNLFKPHATQLLNRLGGEVNIIKFLGNKRQDSGHSKLVESIKKAFKNVKSELDEHLDTINQNTSDIQEFNNILSELDSKIDKLAERMDDFEMNMNPGKARKYDIKLTPREQEVFTILYLSKELALAQIAKQLGFTSDMVNLYIFNLVSKGISINKELIDDVLVFSLDPEFKELQARRNILEIDPRIMRQLTIHEI
jgi:hypothetical protein